MLHVWCKREGKEGGGEGWCSVRGVNGMGKVINGVAVHDGCVLSAHEDGGLRVWKLREESGVMYSLKTLRGHGEGEGRGRVPRGVTA